MAKKKTTSKKKAKKKLKFQFNDRNRLILGLSLLFIAILLLIALVSFFFNWQYDQSNLTLTPKGEPAKNLVGKLGAIIGNTLIYKGFGAMSLLIPLTLFYSGMFIIAKKPWLNHVKRWLWTIIYMYAGVFLLALIFPTNYLWSGVFGKEIAFFTHQIFGKAGQVILLIFILLTILSVKLGLDADKIHSFFKSINWSLYKKKTAKQTVREAEDDNEPLIPTQDIGIMQLDDDMVITPPVDEETVEDSLTNDANDSSEKPEEKPTTEMEIRIAGDEEILEKASELVDAQGPFDPRLELPDYRFPNFDLLKDYGSTDITYNEKELKRNKDKIVKTLLDFKIKISKLGKR